MSKFVLRAVLAIAMGAGMLPFLSPAAQAATATVHVRAVAPGGAPLEYVRWNVYAKDPVTGAWDHGLQMGPLLTDADGWMTWSNAQVGTSYKICLYDDDYDVNTRAERYADRCWVDAADLAGATVWTPTAGQPTLDATITLPAAGHSLTVGHPWVDGTAKLGQALTVRPGVWGPSGVALSYQWVTYDDAGNRTTIAGATSPTFTPAAAQSGKSISVEVTGTLAGYRTATSTAYVGTVGGTTPTMTGALTITGTPTPGNTLTAVTGSFTPADTSAALAWYVNGRKVGTNTDIDHSTLTITPAMAGATVELDMTAFRWAGAPGECCTDQLYASAQVTIGGGVTGTKPTVSGSAVVGSTLTASAGAWGPSGVSLAYQWLRDGAPIGGASSSTYALADADRGKKITVAVTGTLAGGYPPVTRTSDPTGTVQGVLTAATPSISGTPTVGQTLTANPGAWSPTPAYTYQWLAGGTPIPGATSSTYRLVATDQGKAITVTVTGTLTGYVTAAKTSAATAVVQPGALTAATPTIAGTPVVGSTLTADPGSWGPAGVALAYQWLRDDTPITGATTSTYSLTVDDLGSAMTVRVTGSLAGHVTESKTSAASAAVQGMLTGVTPKISGTTTVGKTLTAVTGTWSPTPAFAYQWLRNGGVITGATGATYKLVAADAGKRITVRVTATKAGYGDKTVVSAATAAITGVFAKTPTPTIAGTAKVGKKLTAKPGTWSPAPTLRYQWLRNGKVIKGATRATYQLVKADRGRKITVRVTASRTGYVTVVKTSAARRIA